MQNNEIMVSVCCLVYNHEKYLRKCLDGFLMQKTNFKYEILIHDDASTDTSADIIREYEQKYPDIIKPIYQTENQYSKGVKVSWEFQYPRAKGKYIALCEGDDYWCDENKLQMQFDVMETNPEAAMCVHNVRIIHEDGSDTGKYYPKSDGIKYSMDTEEMMSLLVKEGYPFHTSSYFLRKTTIFKFMDEAPVFKYAFKVGDKPLLLYCVSKGSIVYIDKFMSCWRVGSIDGWTVTNQLNEKNRILNLKHEIAGYVLYDIYTNELYTEYISKMIEYDEFLIYQMNRDYKKIINNKYRWILKRQSIKQRIYYEIVGRFPFMERIYKQIKGK